MGDLRPIGSEKLTGDDKIKRIMEIARYGETNKNEEYHTHTSSFSKRGSDGNVYSIIQERDGYYLKCGINESELDYMSGFMNKKKDRFKSYGSALKRMNLIFKPINEQYNEGVGDGMYDEMEEQEKFVLSVPDEGGDEEMDMDVDMEGGEEEMDMDVEDDMGDEELDMDVEMDDEMDDTGEDEAEMEGFMKPIQKLTGKLGQKLRDVEEELGSADIKYVINSIISAVELDNLDEEDKEDILDRFEDDETEYGDEEEVEDIDMGDDEEGMEMEDEEGMEMGDEDIEVEDEEEIQMESTRKRKRVITEQFFGLSRIIKGIKSLITTGDKLTKEQLETLKAIVAIPLILLSPFGVTSATLKIWKGILANDGVIEGKKGWKKMLKGAEKLKEDRTMKSLRNRVGNLLESYVEKKTTKTNPTQYINSRVKKIQEKQNIKKHYNSIEQELSVGKFLKENKSFNFKTVTKKGNIILNSKDKKVIVSKDGSVI
tara:strand:+ start:8436 stop:9890 length:1455 start_codon:yes stop_codon:yes gene_type:complete